MKKNQTKRLVMNAMMVAIYVVLSMLGIPFAGNKITFEHFPVIVSATLFGPIDGMLVGGVGELMNQMMTYGFTPTTVLWILPIVVRGLMIGLFAKCMPNYMKPSMSWRTTIPKVFFLVCIVTGPIASLLNTFAFYVDSKMLNYYSYALVFGSLLVRLILSVITSVIMATLAYILLPILQRQWNKDL